MTPSSFTEPPPPLVLHDTYGRREIFASVGVAYDQRQQHLNTGLSPQNPDGSYFIFITLSKEDLPDSYDYEDEIFLESFRWVTRRDRDENDGDYVRLRAPGTKILLFVRRANREPFHFLGPLRYRSHQQFRNGGRVQQSYVFALDHRIPQRIYDAPHGASHIIRK